MHTTCQQQLLLNSLLYLPVRRERYE